jgi:outer membrane lipoprotein-sorting protein
LKKERWIPASAGMTIRIGKKIMTKVSIIVLGIVATCWAGGCTVNSAGSGARKESCPVDAVLKQLNQKTVKLKSYQGQIEYKFSQPLLESQTLRRGKLYYQRSGGKSALRINFRSLKQDDEEEQKYIEHYIFDGIWLTHTDYQVKQVKIYQLAEPNKPVDAFELASRNLPIIGFTESDKLGEQFEISLIEQQGGEVENFTRLHLKVKPDSIYEDDYTFIDFWVDKKLYLPAKIVAVTTEEDIYEIKLLGAKVDERIDEEVFEVKIPEGFGMEVIPLKEKTKHK